MQPKKIKIQRRQRLIRNVHCYLFTILHTGTVNISLEYGNRKRKHLFFAIALVSWLIFVHLCRVYLEKRPAAVAHFQSSTGQGRPKRRVLILFRPTTSFFSYFKCFKTNSRKIQMFILRNLILINLLESFKHNHNNASSLCKYWITSSHTLHLLIIALFV